MTGDHMTAAARGRANRARGNEAERNVARWLRDAHGWADATTTRNAERGAGRQSAHGDLAGIPATVEIKCVERPAVHAWLTQLCAEGDDPRRALLWKHPAAALSRPGEWLAIVANHPLDWFDREVRGVRDAFEGIDKQALGWALGWLAVEHAHHADGSGAPALFCATETGDWLLMRADTWADHVLPCWEGLA